MPSFDASARATPDPAAGLDQLRFDNRLCRELPADPITENNRRQVHNAVYSWVKPTPVAAPRLVAHAREVAELLDIAPADCESARFAQVFGGNELLAGMQPHATAYGGHQFGHWAGQLGDGRAINLGEVLNASGQRWVLQLKGAGPTPYSRSADGLAVLRSSIREFLCSEAMHHLGVPTTRALSLVSTGERVLRDMFYDGRPQAEPGAVVCRVAPSFTRFGHFQLPTQRGDIELLKTLVDYTLRVDFPELGEPSRETYCRWFDEICRRTARMIVHWMRVGFVHGVMNTDNMSILGLTIDYGPYGWLEDYDPNWTPNTTDAQGRRYRFGQQPQIAQWNLLQLAYGIYPLIEDVAPLEQVLNDYTDHYQAGWQRMMADKLGLTEFKAETDQALADELHELLAEVETDMTLFYRRLAKLDGRPGDPIDFFADCYYRPEQLNAAYRARLMAWLDDYSARLAQDGRQAAARQGQMNAVNPLYVPRNYLAQLAIDAAEKDDFSLVAELLDTFRQPYTEQPGRERFSAKRPEWARTRAGCSMLSCSS